MSDDDLPERLTLDIRLPLVKDWPRSVRLRRWLKAGWRSYQIKAGLLKTAEPEATDESAGRA